MLAIVDYGAGNQTSVARALGTLGIPCKITDKPDEILASAGIIFPGVGSAGQAMERLTQTGLDACLKEAKDKGMFLLGICLGCQIVLDFSDEGQTKTLGLIAGKCKEFDRNALEEDGTRIRIPHMGWNSLKIKEKSPILANISQNAEFYFVHSYYVEPEEKYVVATTRYGREFCSVYGKDNLWFTQFHPEKSGRPGLTVLKNFYALCKGQ